MANQALYNKWRGQTFRDILGQEHITRTLQNQIRAGRIGHAYLFTGLRGTGKTSTARIMAKAVNCVGETDDPPCNACPICRSITAGNSLDLIELDAASNRGIDEIRDLRDRVSFAPHESRYKVYVIDEVHMLTNEAFNALLKTLEEPPSHVIFILCTTEPHRLPDTILSRCQRFDFRRGSVTTVAANLRMICEREGISITDEALEYIARRATGSFRDGVSLLDQLATYQTGEIDLALVQEVLGSVPLALINRLVEALIGRDVPAGIRAINEAIDNGAEPRQFLSEILDHLRGLLLVRVGAEENLQHLGPETLEDMRRVVGDGAFSPDVLIRAIRLFNEAGQGLRTAARPQLPLELAFIEVVLQSTGHDAVAVPTVQAPSAPSRAPEPSPAVANAQPVIAPTGVADDGPSSTAPPKQVDTPAQAPPAPPASVEAPRASQTKESEEAHSQSAPAQERKQRQPRRVSEAPPAKAPAPEERTDVPPSDASSGRTLTLEWVCNNWNLVLMKVRHRSHQVRALLLSAYPVAVRGDLITLGCEAEFHANMLSDPKRLEVVESVMAEVLGVPCRVECVVKADLKETMNSLRQAAASAPGDLFDAAAQGQDAAAQKDGANASPSRAVSSGGGRGATEGDEREQLRNHPIVKELERRGGRVARVRLYEDGEILPVPPPRAADEDETDDAVTYEAVDDEDDED